MAAPFVEIATPTRTSARSPANRASKITRAQKQALIDNLQLEVTERARKLRSQYALQAQGLRTRLEMRINRIPQGLRKRKLQDLVNEHTQRSKPAPSATVSVPSTKTTSPIAPAPGSPREKRKSEHISQDDDKENAEGQPSASLDNPKKRTKHAANTKIGRKGVQPSLTVLSPRSANSRTLPKSPFKPSKFSSEKPAKSAVVVPAPRAVSRSQKGGNVRKAAVKQVPDKENVVSDANAQRRSDASNTSAGTTVVKKPAAKTTTKKTTVSAAARAGIAAARKAAATRTHDNSSTQSTVVGGGRTLRKRA